jgi:hypothetical protein
MKIDLLFPTKKRPVKFKKALNSVFQTISSEKNICFHFGIEKFDFETLKILKEIDLEKINFISTIFEEEEDLNFKYNHLAQKTENEIIFAVADDIEFRTKNWDLKIIEEYEKIIYSDKIFLFWINDGLGAENLPRHFLLTREAYKFLGYFMQPNLKHYFSDNWIYQLFKNTNRKKFLEDIIVKHHHPRFGEEKDELYIIEHEEKYLDDKKFWRNNQIKLIYERQKLENKIKKEERKNEF